MNVKALFVALVLGLGLIASSAGPARAEGDKATTNQTTKVFGQAGEQSKVLTTLKSGQAVKVLRQEGRWLKIRAKGFTGWVPRSKVDLPEAEEDLARNTRRRPFVDGRGTKRGFGGEGGPTDRVGADATESADSHDAPEDGEAEPTRTAKRSEPEEPEPAARRRPAAGEGEDDVKVKDDEVIDVDGDAPAKRAPQATGRVAKRTAVLNDPSADSEPAFTADPKTPLLIGETSGAYTFVQTEDGDAGYVLTSKLETDEPAAGDRARTVHLRGRLGLTLVSQSLSTPGANPVIPENYSAGGPTLTVALGGSVLYPYGPRYWIGGDFTYDFNKGVSDIKYMTGTTGFTYHSLNLRGTFGYDLQKKNGMAVFGRLGLHYDSFQLSDVADFTKNTAKIPNQIITSPTIGGALAIPRLTSKLGLVVSLDITVFGASVQQTKNLEDGTNPSARSAFLGAIVTYKWKPKMDLQATYDLGYTSLSFGGAPPANSQRGHMGTAPRSGSDLNNALAFGIVYSL